VYNSSRATSHTRVRARDHCTSSTLIGGNGGAGPSSLHTTLEGPKEYVNAKWMQSLHGFLHGIRWTMFHCRLDCLQKSPLGGKPNTKPGDHDIPNVHNRWSILFYHVWGPAWIEIALGWGLGHIWLHTTLEGPWPHYMILEVSWNGVWTFSLGPSQFQWSRLSARVWSGPYILIKWL
jgi:hypothetical protein